MDYEKKYKEAIEKLRSLHDDYDTVSTLIDIKEELEYIFPELKDEDTRIKACISMCLTDVNEQRFKDYGTTLKDCLAWLEKQDDQKLPIEKLPEEMKTVGESLGFTTQKECDEYNQMVLDLIMSDSKVEQKPACLLDNSKSNIEFPFKAKVKRNGKIVTIHGGQLSMDGKEWIKYQSNKEDGYMVYEPEDLELVYNIEQKPVDKIEPKFKAGDWVVCDALNTAKIINIDGDRYKVEFIDGNKGFPHIDYIDRLFHLWTVKDAKDGDVLCNGKMIVIFKHFEEPSYRQHIVAYIGLDIIGNIQITDDTWNLGIDKTKPATKEQRNTLFAKMKEAGYEWDAEKKKLKKIEQKSVGEEIVEALRTEYEKGRADAFAQMQKEWSEEDEVTINRIRSIVEKYAFSQSAVDVNGDLCEKEYIDADNWLKSLKGRYTWKPSEELDEASYQVGIKRVLNNPESYGLTKYNWKPSKGQMEALYEETQKSDRIRDDRIVSIYNDLKKLNSE